MFQSIISKIVESFEGHSGARYINKVTSYANNKVTSYVLP